MAREIKVSRKKKIIEWFLLAPSLWICKRLATRSQPSWCFSWCPLITGLGSTNISSKKLLKSPWHLVITSLQSLLIGVCAGGSNPAQGGIQGAADRSGIDTGLTTGYWPCSPCCPWWDLTLAGGILTNQPRFFCFFSRVSCQTVWQHPHFCRGITISLLPKLLEATAPPGTELPEHEYFMGLVLGRLLMVEFSWPITRFLWLSALLW